MKAFTKISLLLSALALLVPLAACTPKAAESGASSSMAESSDIVRPISVVISKDVCSATGADLITLTNSLGLNNVTKNEDGSYTVKMTQAEQSTIQSTLLESLTEQISALPENDNWQFLEKIELDNTLQNVKLYTTAAHYNEKRDNTIAEAVYIPVLLYTAFTGDTTDLTLHFTVLDKNGTVLSTFDYPQPEAASQTPESGGGDTDNTDSDT